MNTPLELDHIDPKWKEGRDYQLVCGLSCAVNLIEREKPLNAQKSNRFLPWRISSSEIGSIPTNPGDLCLFLDLTTGGWVLEEFMGDWWFAHTRKLCGQFISSSKTQNLTHDPETQTRRGERSYDLKVGIHAAPPERRQEISKIANEVQREKETGFYSPSLQTELALRPRSSEALRRKREASSKTHLGARVYNNGVEDKRFKEPPGEEWVLGSLFKWFNDGVNEDKFKMGEEPKGWKRGRVKTK